MYKNSGSQFFKTTTGILSRSVMTILIIFKVTEILCSFSLVLEGKTGKEIPESSRDNTSEPLKTGGISDLPLLKILLAICQKS